MRDIETRLDIEKLMTAFYDKAFADDLIGHYFTDVTHLNLEKHLPVIVNFWETILLKSNNYHNNAMEAHRHIHSLSPFKAEHFQRWVKIFTETVDELFRGDIAENAKLKATSVGSAMTLIFANPNT